MHHIVASSAINMIDLRLSGFLTCSEVEALAAEFRGHFIVGKIKPGYLLLVDIGSCAIQSQEVMGVFVALVRDAAKAKRIAVICDKAAIQLQLKRVMTQPYLRIVPDRTAALGWLTREVDPALAA